MMSIKEKIGRVSILLLLCLICLSTQAQISFGPRLTATSSKLNLENTAEFDADGPELGFQYGVFARIKLKKLSLQPEVLINSLKTGFLVAGVGSFRVDLSQIQVPIMVGYKIIGPLRIQAGPVFSFLSDAEITDQFSMTTDASDIYESVTIGYQIGLGIDITKFVFDLKYEGSLSNLADFSNNVGFRTDQSQSQFVFALGFKLF